MKDFTILLFFTVTMLGFVFILVNRFEFCSKKKDSPITKKHRKFFKV